MGSLASVTDLQRVAMSDNMARIVPFGNTEVVTPAGDSCRRCGSPVVSAVYVLVDSDGDDRLVLADLGDTFSLDGTHVIACAPHRCGRSS